jgi:hypothetical protein
VLQRLVAAIPAAATAAGTSSEVLLANGARIRVAEVAQKGGRQVFKLANGMIFSPPEADVLEVRSVSDQPASRPRWQDIAPRIASLTHPIDIFIAGVQPCFQNGLDREGFALLDKLLARPDADQVPLLFVPEAGADVLADWRLAAGRPAPAAGAAAGRRESEEADGSPAGPGSDQAPLDPQALVQVAQLVGEARALYGSAAGKDGREGDIRAARERLDRALQILEPLPPGDESVKKLRRQIAQLLSDVSRTASF